MRSCYGFDSGGFKQRADDLPGIVDMLLGRTTYGKKQRHGDPERQGMDGKVDVQGYNSSENKIHIIKYFIVHF